MLAFEIKVVYIFICPSNSDLDEGLKLCATGRIIIRPYSTTRILISYTQ